MVEIALMVWVIIFWSIVAWATIAIVYPICEAWNDRV